MSPVSSFGIPIPERTKSAVVELRERPSSERKVKGSNPAFRRSPLIASDVRLRTLKTLAAYGIGARKSQRQ